MLGFALYQFSTAGLGPFSIFGHRLPLPVNNFGTAGPWHFIRLAQPARAINPYGAAVFNKNSTDGTAGPLHFNRLAQLAPGHYSVWRRRPLHNS